MARNVFRGNELAYKQHRVFLAAPESAQPAAPVAELADVEEYTGPTVDQLRREAEAFKQSWETEREQMIAAAREEADRVLKAAEDEAFRQIKAKTEEATRERAEAEAEVETLRTEGRNRADAIVSEAEERAKKIEADAFERGREEGREEGIQVGRTESERLIQRFHVILSKAIERRNEIIEESEQQVIGLVLSIAKKVIKVISENQKNVVVNNIVQSLQRLQQKSDVIVRVNLSDLAITSQHKEDILRVAERVSSITIAEDTTVDVGGCIIETDFGEIDARIASQLREIEDRIIELVPIKTRAKMVVDGV